MSKEDREALKKIRDAWKDLSEREKGKLEGMAEAAAYRSEAKKDEIPESIYEEVGTD